MPRVAAMLLHNGPDTIQKTLRCNELCSAKQPGAAAAVPHVGLSTHFKHIASPAVRQHRELLPSQIRAVLGHNMTIVVHPS